MEIQFNRADEILIISLEGRLDSFGATQLDEMLEEHITEDDFAVVIDMVKASYLSSGGIQTFLATDKMLKRRETAGFGSVMCNPTRSRYWRWRDLTSSFRSILLKRLQLKTVFL